MTVREITQLIEDFAPLSLQANYDNTGLICGDNNNEVKSVLLCIDVTEEVITEAIHNGHNLIISHHPLIFSGIKKFTPDNYINRCIIQAVKHDLNIYAAHTNVDSVEQGVSGRMADKLHLTDRKILCPETTRPETGFGIIGNLDQSLDSLQFLKLVKTAFQCKALRHSPLVKKEIKKVALCGGSGASLIPDAIRQQADIYITGDIKYHDFFAAEHHLIIADIGHYESEQYTKDIFYELLTKKISKFAVQFSKVNTNPINYL